MRGDFAAIRELAKSRTPKPSAFARRLAAGLSEEDGEGVTPVPVLRQAQDED